MNCHRPAPRRRALTCLFWLAAVLAMVAGCSRSTPDSEPDAPSVAKPEPPPLYLGHAQTNLPVFPLLVGPVEIQAEIASTARQIATGLMHRPSLEPDRGMLFLFGRPHRVSFYMRNTLIPLSLAYLDPQGVIVEIHDGQPLDETPLEALSDRVQFVLEMNQGWFEREGVGVGDLVTSPLGGLREVFVERPRRR